MRTHRPCLPRNGYAVTDTSQSQCPRHQALLARFGAAVRSQRRRQNITLHLLAETTQLSRSYLGQIERGERNPSLATIFRIAEGLHIKYADLFLALDASDPPIEK